MAYERVNWENLPSTNTPVNADNLNKMDEGIKDLETELSKKANSSDVYTKTETDTELNKKQDELTAGTGIEITGENTINNIQGNYSTEEQVIGTWVDGKPLYRRIVTTTMPSVEADGTYPGNQNLHISFNIDNIINTFYKMTIVNPGKTQSYNLPYLNNAGRVAKAFLENSTEYGLVLSTTTNGIAFSQATVIAIIEYTKTTD